MVGTIGFIDKCFYEYGIFSKEEVLLILNSIKASKFRINSEIIDNEINKVEKN
jgi:predicted nucleic acid-binding protein